MSKVLKIKRKRWLGRKARIRTKISGTAQTPRVSIFFSNKNVFAQIIDDGAGKTLASASTCDKEAQAKGKNKSAAKYVGATLGEKAAGLGIKKAVFDRNGYSYHGKVKELADAIKEKGISL